MWGLWGWERVKGPIRRSKTVGEILQTDKKTSYPLLCKNWDINSTLIVIFSILKSNNFLVLTTDGSGKLAAAASS